MKPRSPLLPIPVALLLVLISLSSTVAAKQKPELVELSATLEPDREVVPGERVRLVIKVATPRWFTGGTRIKLPEVPGLILLQNQDFASNATERRGAESWSVQRWSIDAFANQPGNIRIPPVSVRVSVSETPAREYKATLETKPLTLTVELPEALAELDDWIASPEVTLTQEIDAPDPVPLGGAIRRRLVISAKDVVAMLLPSPPNGDSPLLQTYRDPPVLRNRANRGSLLAERRDSTTWIASEPGETTLEPITLNWWNTKTRELTVLTTEPVTLTLYGDLPERPASKEMQFKRGLMLALGLLVLIMLWRLQQVGLGRWVWAQARAGWHYVQRGWQLLRNPVLGDRLNPGGSRGVSSAGEPHER